MNCNTITTLIGVGGTALGVFITSLFNLLSKRSEHTMYIRRFRAERAFNFCEELIAHVRSAEYEEPKDSNGKKIFINLLLSHQDAFEEWYAQFVDMWYSKQYLLDKPSVTACQYLHNFLFELNNRYGGETKETSLQAIPQEDLADISQQFRDRLVAVHEPIESFLKQGIEEA